MPEEGRAYRLLVSYRQFDMVMWALVAATGQPVDVAEPGVLSAVDIPEEVWLPLQAQLATQGVEVGGPVGQELFFLTPSDEVAGQLWTPAFPFANPEGARAPETADLRHEKVED